MSERDVLESVEARMTRLERKFAALIAVLPYGSTTNPAWLQGEIDAANADYERAKGDTDEVAP